MLPGQLASREAEDGSHAGGRGRGLAVLAMSGIARRLAILGFPEIHGFNVAIWGVVIAAVWQQSGYTGALPGRAAHYPR